ncbi:hypothetical protein CFC21_045614 [Triticum aestivum]|uniref:WPP domain-containing protein n=2 Tax=Triticum aestivum TaxID=4565 RepID=A0A9R1JYW4_WHEAT|nr:hypothetical protein CFC21_045614 [Triticum aestivum]
MSGRRSCSRHALSTAANSGSRSVPPYSRSAAAEGRRRSIDRSAALRSLAATLPPGYDPSLLPMCSWPPSQESRESTVRILLQKLVGPSLYCVHYGAVPEPEARRTAAAIEAESFAAVSEYASGATLATRKERFAVYKMYLKEACDRLLAFFKFRAAAMGGMLEPGDSSAPTLAVPAPAPASAPKE